MQSGLLEHVIPYPVQFVDITCDSIQSRKILNEYVLNTNMRYPLPGTNGHWLVQCTLEYHWNATGSPKVHWDITGRPSKYLQGALEHYWQKRSWNCHPLECHWRNSDNCSLYWNTTGGNSAFTWSLLFCNGYQFCSSNVWVLQHHSVHALDMSTILYIGGCKWNQLSSNNFRHTSCIYIRGCMLGNDLTLWLPNRTLSVHWTDYPGTTLADAIT